MNRYSKSWSWTVVLLAVLAGACGGGSDDGAAGKADWEKKHGAVIGVVSDDIDRSEQALGSGQRPVVLSECTQLQEDLVDARKALPVPDPTVDAALRSALDATTTGVGTCVEGARVASQADIVEKAQREMKTARERYTAAQDAIKAWQ